MIRCYFCEDKVEKYKPVYYYRDKVAFICCRICYAINKLTK